MTCSASLFIDSQHWKGTVARHFDQSIPFERTFIYAINTFTDRVVNLLKKILSTYEKSINNVIFFFFFYFLIIKYEIRNTIIYEKFDQRYQFDFSVCTVLIILNNQSHNDVNCTLVSMHIRDYVQIVICTYVHARYINIRENMPRFIDDR